MMSHSSHDIGLQCRETTVILILHLFKIKIRQLCWAAEKSADMEISNGLGVAIAVWRTSVL